MLVRDVMTTQLQTIGPEARIEDAFDAIKRNRIHQLPVMDGGGMIGIVTDRDLRRGAGSTGRMRVQDVMTAEVRTIRPDTPAVRAARMLILLGVGALPVVDEDHQLVGIVTRSDLLAALVGKLDRERFLRTQNA